MAPESDAPDSALRDPEPTSPPEETALIGRSVTINRPRDQVYAFLGRGEVTDRPAEAELVG